MRKLVLAGIVSAALLGAPSLGSMHAQINQQTPLGQTSGSNNSRNLPSIDGRSSESGDPSAAIRQQQIARLQNNERQKRLVEDTDKLLKLATELKEDVDKSNKDQMSLEVIRKAEEVERLAHDVKIRMRG